MSEVPNHDQTSGEGLGAYAAAAAEGQRLNAEAAAASGPAEQDSEANQHSGEAAVTGQSEAQPGVAGGGSEGAQAQGEDLAADLAAAQEARIAQLDEDLARARAAHYNLEQEYSNYVRRTKAEIPTHREAGIGEVVNALLSVLDDIELARQHGDLSGSFASVAEKLEQTLENKFGVRRFGKVGQAFDPALHQAIQYLGEEGQGEMVIAQVAQPGYLQQEKILRPAIVIAGHGEVSEAPTEISGGD